jgi:hypothetical protein
MRKAILKGVNRIIVHGNCPDGMASAILLYDALKIEPEFYLHSMDSFQNLKVTPRTLFCDICPPEHLVDKFVDTGGIVLDHHKAVESHVLQFGKRGVFADEKKDPGVSGAYLAFREVWMPLMRGGINRRYTAAQRFARLAGIRDTWQKHEEDWEIACHQAAALTFYPWSHWKNQVDRNGHDGNDRYLQFSDEMVVGKLIFDNRISKARACAAEAHIVTRRGFRVAVFNDSDKLTSDVADILRSNGVDVIAGFFYSKTSKDSVYPILCYSLRSNGSFDVAKFAGRFGGGGHTQSAGYRKTICMDDDPFSIFLNDLEAYGN